MLGFHSDQAITKGMWLSALMLEWTLGITAPGGASGGAPSFFGRFGLMLLPLLALSAAALAVMIDRYLVYHRERINAAEFLAGVRNVLRRDSVVEAISICEATPGPVSRLVKAAILSRDGGRERVQEAIEEVGLVEVPRLEARLNVLATVAQVAPLVGLLGTLFGFIGAFEGLHRTGTLVAPAELFGHLWHSLYSAAGGLSIAIVSYLAYNYLVGRVNAIVLDMERASSEALRMVISENGTGLRGK